MTKPTSNQVHWDSILTGFSLRYMNEQNAFIADRVFPIVDVNKQSDVYYTYDKLYWFSDDMARRAPGTEFPETRYGLNTASYTCATYALSKPIADEDRNNADAPIDLDTEAAELLATKALIRREVSFSAYMTSDGTWTSNDSVSATDWDTSTGVPVTAVGRAIQTVVTLTGMKPNTVAVGLIVDIALKTNAEITGLIKYVTRALPADLDNGLIALALGVDKYHVSSAAYTATHEGQTPTMTAIIDDDALVVYSPDRPTIRSASGGLTFMWAGGGGMGSVERVRADLRRADIARIQSSFVHKLVSADLGYFFGNIV